MTGTTYATLVELKLQLGITDTTEDTLLNKALSTASRAVEKACGNRVFTLDGSATARVYVPQGNYDLDVDDIGTLTGLLVETGSGTTYTTLPATAYETTPTTALVRGEPITSLNDLGYAGVWWSGGVTPRVRVTACWGWPAIPDEVSQATLITAARLFRRKGSPEGVAGFGDMGVVRVPKLDPDVQAMLQPLKRYAIA
jgi:hypothetical protein